MEPLMNEETIDHIKCKNAFLFLFSMEFYLIS